MLTALKLDVWCFFLKFKAVNRNGLTLNLCTSVSLFMRVIWVDYVANHKFDQSSVIRRLYNDGSMQNHWNLEIKIYTHVQNLFFFFKKCKLNCNLGFK